MKLSEDDIREIQRLYTEGTPIRELARCYNVDANTIRYQCRGVVGEPIKRLERAEILHLIYVRNPLTHHANIDSLWITVDDDRRFYPRLSRMTRMRFAQVISQMLNELGWERSSANSRAYTYSKPELPVPVMIEW